MPHPGLRTMMIFLLMGPVIGLAAIGLVKGGPIAAISAPLTVLFFAGLLGWRGLAVVYVTSAIAGVPSMLFYFVTRRVASGVRPVIAAVFGALVGWSVFAVASFGVEWSSSVTHAKMLIETFVATVLTAVACATIDHFARKRDAAISAEQDLSDPVSR